MSARQQKSAKVESKRRPQGRDAEATKAAFISAGERVFARHGFDGSTLDMLAAEAGANKALVSYYFGSKEGLYDVVIAALARETIASLSARVTASGDPAQDLKRYIATLTEEFASRPAFLSILMREYVGGSMQTRKTPAEEVFQFFRMTESLYERGRCAKSFRKVDPHLLHLSIVGPIVHFVLTAPFREAAIGRVVHGVSNPTVTAFAAHLSGLVLDGLRRAD